MQLAQSSPQDRGRGLVNGSKDVFKVKTVGLGIQGAGEGDARSLPSGEHHA